MVANSIRLDMWQLAAGSGRPCSYQSWTVSLSRAVLNGLTQLLPFWCFAPLRDGVLLYLLAAPHMYRLKTSPALNTDIYPDGDNQEAGQVWRPPGHGPEP